MGIVQGAPLGRVFMGSPPGVASGCPLGGSPGVPLGFSRWTILGRCYRKSAEMPDVARDALLSHTLCTIPQGHPMGHWDATPRFLWGIHRGCTTVLRIFDCIPALAYQVIWDFTSRRPCATWVITIMAPTFGSWRVTQTLWRPISMRSLRTTQSIRITCKSCVLPLWFLSFTGLLCRRRKTIQRPTHASSKCCCDRTTVVGVPIAGR